MPAHGKKLARGRIVTIGVLIAGVLAVAAWQYQRGRTRQILETVKDDLRNLAAAQEGYSVDHAGAFMPSNSAVTTTTHHHGYAPSAGVSVNIADPASGGWSATATQEGAPGKICGIYVGGSPPGPPNPARISGEPICSSR